MTEPAARQPVGEAERYRTLLEINNALIANLTREAVGLEISPTESHVGLVFQQRRPFVRRDLEHERQYPPAPSTTRVRGARGRW